MDDQENRNRNGEGEGRLARWSKRKLDQKKPRHLADGSISQNPDGKCEGEAISADENQLRLQQNLEDAQSVDLDALGAGSDVSVFFREGVPATLRKKALAMLWRSDPVFAGLDELVDYGQDFANPALNMETFVSAYKVGSGYMEKLKAEAELAANKLQGSTDMHEDIPEEADGVITSSTDEREDTAVAESPASEVSEGQEYPVRDESNEKIAEATGVQDGEQPRQRQSIRRRMDLDNYVT